MVLRASRLVVSRESGAARNGESQRDIAFVLLSLMLLMLCCSQLFRP